MLEFGAYMELVEEDRAKASQRSGGNVNRCRRFCSLYTFRCTVLAWAVLSGVITINYGYLVRYQKNIRK